MNRQERRRKERYIEKEMSVLRKLPEKDLLKINEIINKVAKSKADEALNLIDRSFSAILVNRGMSFKEIEKLQDELAEYMKEDQEKIIELEKENVDMAKLQKEVREFIEGLIRAGKGRKEVIEETMFKFPKLSKTATNNAYGKILDELEIEDAASYILEDNKELKKVVEKEEAKKVSEEVARQLEKEEHIAEVSQKIEEVKEEKEVSKGLEIIEKEVIKIVKAKGIHGIYEAKTGIGVALENEGYKIAFKDVNELEVFCNEFKKIFEEI